MCSTYSRLVSLLFRKGFFVKPPEVQTVWPHRQVQRYFDDLFTIDNPEFVEHIPDIYPLKLQWNKANTPDKEASFLDSNITVIRSNIHTSVYDKSDDFVFPIHAGHTGKASHENTMFTCASDQRWGGKLNLDILLIVVEMDTFVQYSDAFLIYIVHIYCMHHNLLKYSDYSHCLFLHTHGHRVKRFEKF